MIRLTYNGKRICLAILLAIAFSCIANLVLDLHIFGRYDSEVFALVIMVMFIFIYVIGPSKSEIEEYQEMKVRKKNSS